MDALATLTADTINDALFAKLAQIVRDAGAMTMKHFRNGARIAGRIDWKPGNSPVTEVDLAVDAFLRRELSALLPDAGWLSEETADTPERLEKRRVFVVDPIDGTRAFMEGDPRFAVSVALVVDGRPVAAVIDAPAIDQLYTARAGHGASLNAMPIARRPAPALRGAKLAGPKFLIEVVARDLAMAAQPKVPSLALRFAQTGAGDFAAAIASKDAHDWDIAAADLILHEAGLELRTLEDAEPVYNRDGTKHDVLIAAARPLQAPLRDAVRTAMAQKSREGSRR